MTFNPFGTSHQEAAPRAVEAEVAASAADFEVVAEPAGSRLLTGSRGLVQVNEAASLRIDVDALRARLAAGFPSGYSAAQEAEQILQTTAPAASEHVQEQETIFDDDPEARRRVEYSFTAAGDTNTADLAEQQAAEARLAAAERQIAEAHKNGGMIDSEAFLAEMIPGQPNQSPQEAVETQSPSTLPFNADVIRQAGESVLPNTPKDVAFFDAFYNDIKADEARSKAAVAEMETQQQMGTEAREQIAAIHYPDGPNNDTYALAA
jgi:hypothetical protein